MSERETYTKGIIDLKHIEYYKKAPLIITIDFLRSDLQ